MATNTSIKYRNETIYSIFIRNYCKNGKFKDVEKDLKRIKNLGVDIIWLLPIYPIGEKKRKGKLGSPYSIKDYRSINPEYGNFDDFISLVNSIHSFGMKCIIDIVYNHTSPDSVLVKEHPEWFYHDKNGNLGNKIGGWEDIVDLDYSNQKLWDYQIETLKMWAGYVDGFRCDVAPLVPLSFWKQARQEVSKVNPNTFWLAESVEPSFIQENRRKNIICLSDSEIFQAFDACYDYDIYDVFLDYIMKRRKLTDYVERINLQEAIYPKNYIKLRFLENHDRLRAKTLFSNDTILFNWLAFNFFQKGITLIYAGQEYSEEKRPNLFNADEISRDGKDLSKYIFNLSSIKKDEIFRNGSYHVEVLNDTVLHAYYRENDSIIHGYFNTGVTSELIKVPFEDGLYYNIIDSSVKIEIDEGLFQLKDRPVIIKV